ncbi:undecaprenyl diphosphate synthase family protein [bacterium]|nr:undecaprenyl diphosphate synthase family protein [bacterium]
MEFLFKYLDDYVKSHQQEFIDSNLKFFWTGFEDKLPRPIINDLQSLVNNTKDHTGLIINFVFNYGGMQDIVHACNQIQKLDHEVDMEEFSSYLLTKNLPQVDLMIRTSGEERISNFLLYQIAYAEFIFEPTKFPDYTLDIFKQNLAEFKTRDIRKGGYGNASKK